MVHHNVGLYFVGAAPLIRAEWTPAPRLVNIDMMPLAFLKPPKGRLAILMETMQSSGRATTRRNSGLLGVCLLHGLGGKVLDLRRIVCQHFVISKLDNVILEG